MALNNPYALHFDGVDDHALGPQLSTYNTGTVECVIQVLHEHIGAFVGTYSTTTDGSNRQLALSVYPYTQDRFRIHISAVSTDNTLLFTAVTTSGFTYGEPHHVAYTSQHGSRKVDLIVDGIIQDMTTEQGTMTDCFFGRVMQPSDRLQIGAKRDTNGVHSRPFRGIVDEFRLWNYVRTLEQIQTNAHRRLTGSETGLVVYYRFDEGTGDVAYDSSPNGYHGEIVGATWVPGEIDLTPTEHLSLFSPLDITLTAKAKSYIGLGVSSLPATNIGSKSMTLNGKLKGLGNYAGAECSFQYYPVDQYKNYALKFDGVDDKISFNKAIIPTDGGPWTISFMAKIDSLSTGQSSVISQYAPGSDNRFSIHANFDSGYWSMVQEPALGVVDIAPIVLGEVAYITVSYDGEKLKCYKNDICVTTVEISNLEIPDLPTLIGNRNRTGYNDTFNGIIDELSVWSRALSKEEIEEHLHQELTGAEEGLIAYYRFNEGEGDILHDCSRNYNDGIIHGAQWVDSPFKLMPPKEKLEITEIPTVEFSDDFDRSTLGPDWEIAPDSQGSVQLQNGELVLTGGSSRRMWVRTTRTFEAHSIVFRARRDSADAGSDVGLAFNWDGNFASEHGEPLNGYRLFWAVWGNPSVLRIARYDNGVYTDLASIAFPPDNNEHEFAILIEDGTIRVFVDGVQMLQASDSTYTSGYIGLAAREGGNRRSRYNWIVVKGTKEEKVLMPTPLRETPSQKIYFPYTLVKTVTPKEVNGLYFDGVNDRVTISHNALLKPTRITLMAWVEKDDWSDNDINSSKIISCTQAGGYGLQVNRDSGLVGILAYIGGDYRNAYAPKPASGKHFICGTYDGKYLRTYIDGELAKETAYSGSISYSVNNAVMIGAEPDSGSNVQAGYYFKGKISNVSIWNRAITAEEVKYYYENGLKGNEHGLVAYYKMDEGEGNKIYNSSLYKDEYNLDGTISGATWDIVSLPETKYKYEPGVKFSSIITPGEYKPISGVIKGLRFDGVDDYVLFGNDSIFRSNLTSITIEAIIKPEKVSGDSFIFDVGFYANKGYGLSIANSSVIFRTPTDYGGASLHSTTNINTGSIYYVTCVLDGESDLMKIYINGVLEGQVAVSPSLVLNSTTVTTDDDATRARIGSQAKAGYRSERFFKGELYQFRFWNRALSDEEIALYYNKRITQDFPGLVINYSFDKDVGGNVLVDSSPSYNHGAIYGAQRIDADVPLYSIDREPSGTRYYYRAVAKGLPDYALGFNGTSSYSEIGGRETTSPLAINEEYTCIVKFKTNVISSFRQPILSQNNNSGDYNYHSRGLAIRENQLRFWSRDSSRVLHEMTYPISPNTWYCAALVQDRNVIKGFLDGVSIGQLNMGSFMTGYESYHAIGTWTAEKTDFFDGSIKEVQIYNRALSEEEIKQYQEIQLVGNEPGLVAYYRIVEGEGDILVDHTMNQNHGTIYGATWEQL